MENKLKEEEKYTICPRCGVVKGKNTGEWLVIPEEEPCSDVNECIIRLNERVYELESRLESVEMTIRSLKNI